MKKLRLDFFLGWDQHDLNHGLDEQDVKLDIAVDDGDPMEQEDEQFDTNPVDDRCASFLIVIIILMIISLCIYSMMYK